MIADASTAGSTAGSAALLDPQPGSCMDYEDVADHLAHGENALAGTDSIT